MVIRRKSDAVPKQPTACKYHREFEHETRNQYEHEQRQHMEDDHDVSICWCCCESCTDLGFYHEEPSSLLTPSGELRPRWESAASPTSAGTSPSS